MEEIWEKKVATIVATGWVAMEETAAVTLAEFMKFNSKDLFDIGCTLMCKRRDARHVKVAGDASGLAGDKPSPGLAEWHASEQGSRGLRPSSVRSKKYLKDGAASVAGSNSLIWTS
ncbi:hypothetical protein C8J57DRAFT_1228758 [Mycena rebaudengoi]|nr:hypothetical protein C8J57DRAFT_1228758 [Mycena rebaudengoi]